jgi:succinate dehydrogenase hydrophobic anchor subunit
MSDCAQEVNQALRNTFVRIEQIMKSLATLLTVSLIVAIVGLVPHKYIEPDSDMALILRIYGPATVWLLLFVAALTIHGKRGLWLLVGAPLAMFPPWVMTYLHVACTLQWLGPTDCP